MIGQQEFKIGEWIFFQLKETTQEIFADKWNGILGMVEKETVEK